MVSGNHPSPHLSWGERFGSMMCNGIVMAKPFFGWRGVLGTGFSLLKGETMQNGI
jgi:hypothetical protein